MHMESPERLSFGASLEGQESPLFNFLCTLSPIKPIRSLHASQSFTELSFPPPPAVFVTPRVPLKSSLHRSSYKSEQTVSLGHSNSIQNDDREDVPCMGQRNTQNQDKSADLLCTSSTQFLEPQLSECMAAESSTACSTVLTSVCVSNARSRSSVDILSSRDLDQCNSLRVEGTITPPILDSDNKEHMASLVGNSETSQGSRPLEPFNVVHLCSYGTVDDKEALDMDEEAADLVLLLSEVTDKTAPLHENLEGWQKATSSTLSDMSSKHMSGCLPSFYGNTNEKAQDRQLDSFLMQMSTDCGDRKSANAYREQQEGAANKVNFPVQRGFRRRCLDFRVSDSHWKGKGTASLKLMQSNSYSRSQSTSTYPSDQDIHVTVLKERILATSDAINSDSTLVNTKTSKPRLSQGHLLKDAPADLDGQLYETCPPCGTSSSPPNILSGIGLHLNSLTSSMPLLQSSRGVDDFSTYVKFSSAVMGTKSKSRIQLADKHGVSSPPANSENSMQSGANFDGDLAVSVVEKTEILACKDDIISASESVACVGSFTTRTKQLKECVSSAGLEKLPTHLDQERVLLPVRHSQIDFDGGQDSSTTQTRKSTRKRALTVDISGDGCKRCNCKKSKCLKLYCECFAAGVFCIDSCSCNDCHNKPSFEDTVLETRQQIESRNPLAFAPKIMPAVANSPMSGEKAIDVTPTSARHKKGCSCKKSKCLKKYCECYQAAVGCSKGCRCENCENLYGRKEGSEGKDVGEGLKGKEVTEEKMDTSDFCSELEHVAQYRHDDLSPITPSFQYAGPTIYRSSTRCFSKKGLQSPDSLLPSSKPPKTVLQPLRSSKAAKNSFDVYKIGRQLPSPPGCSPKSLRSGQFSPRWDGLGDICTLTPLPQAPHRPTTPSASFVYGTDSSPSLNVLQCGGPPSSGSDSVCNVSLPQCSSPTCHQVSDSSTTNYHTQTATDLQSTPTTPIVNAPFSGMGLESPYEGSMFFCTKIGGFSEDAIPAILKGPEPARSSIFSLKSNSPKQKRVSPPHFVGSRIISQGRGESLTLRNGRKFTLHSVSSVPTTYSSI